MAAVSFICCSPSHAVASSCFVQCLGQLLFVYVSALGVLASIRQPSAAASAQLLLAFSYLSISLSSSISVLLCLSLFIPCQTLNTLATCHSYAACFVFALLSLWQKLLSTLLSHLSIKNILLLCFVFPRKMVFDFFLSSILFMVELPIEKALGWS